MNKPPLPRIAFALVFVAAVSYWLFVFDLQLKATIAVPSSSRFYISI